MYKVSNELFAFLKANGLVDNSHIYAAEDLNQYRPGKHDNVTRRKWTFGSSRNKQMLTFDFDYINMYVTEGSTPITAMVEEFTVNQIKSIITYFKLSHAHRKIIRAGTGNRIENWHDRPSPSLKSSAAAKAFETIFEQIKI